MSKSDDIIRFCNHKMRIIPFSHSEEYLSSERLINRTLYGTDYDPDEVKFIKRPPMNV